MHARADLVWADVEDCRQMAGRLADWLAQLPRSSRLLVLLNGTLGSGKTQFVKFLVDRLSRQGPRSAATSDDSARSSAGEPHSAADEAAPQSLLAATSPTFSLEHRYPTVPPLIHLDLYRIDDEDQLWELGLEETLEEPGVVVVEWAERFANYWPSQRLTVTIDLLPNDHRHVLLEAAGELHCGGLRAICSP